MGDVGDRARCGHQQVAGGGEPEALAGPRRGEAEIGLEAAFQLAAAHAQISNKLTSLQETYEELNKKKEKTTL